MKKPLYTYRELNTIAMRVNSFLEMMEVSMALKWLYCLGENIDLIYFNKQAHIRAKQLIQNGKID